MDLLLIRHAIAEDRATFAATGLPDSERPLTARGTARMGETARGLLRAAPQLDLVATSPYVRARQTADIVVAAYGSPPVEETETLVPDAVPLAFAKWIGGIEGGNVAAVGHEPHLSELAAWLVNGTEHPLFAFKKGGACLLSFDGPIDAGTADLRWVLTPKLLRGLAA